MNVVILIGRLTRDPELSYTSSNKARCVFTLAVDRPSRDDQADFPRIVVWGNSAESCNRYLRKGSQCAVRGSIATGSYKNRDGVTVYTTDVWADRVKFLDTRSEPRDDEPFDDGAFNEPFDPMSYDPIGFSASDDDIPF